MLWWTPTLAWTVTVMAPTRVWAAVMMASDAVVAPSRLARTAARAARKKRHHRVLVVGCGFVRGPVSRLLPALGGLDMVGRQDCVTGCALVLVVSSSPKPSSASSPAAPGKASPLRQITRGLEAPLPRHRPLTGLRRSRPPRNRERAMPQAPTPGRRPPRSARSSSEAWRRRPS